MQFVLHACSAFPFGGFLQPEQSRLLVSRNAGEVRERIRIPACGRLEEVQPCEQGQARGWFTS
jgi:hypothetical protein